ncbi:hypothetical protein TNCV_2188811 [Trichonephila clavipes]|nr:hypothetical protein TNCV_2188811 [Trichonephila clavipes]
MHSLLSVHPNQLKEIPLHITDNESYETDAVFFVELGEPKLEEDVDAPENKDYLREQSGQDINENQEDLSEDEKIALLGKPRLGEQYKVQIRIKESREFKCDSNDDQKGSAVKRNGTPDHNFWLRDSVACNSESRIGTLPWASPDTSSMIVRTQLEARFVAKHYTPPVSLISTSSRQAPP